MSRWRNDTLSDRFWSKVHRVEPDACWLWMGAKTPTGYGSLKPEKGARTTSAHRIAWFLTHGIIPEGICVCHRCDVPACCNPAHLFLGTQQDNLLDMHQKGRASGNTTRPMRGELNGQAKLTTNRVQEIRLLMRTGMPSSDIARRFDVSPQTICDIRKGRKWSHVPQGAA